MLLEDGIGAQYKGVEADISEAVWPTKPLEHT